MKKLIYSVTAMIVLLFAGFSLAEYLLDRPGAGIQAAFSTNPDCLPEESEPSLLIDAASRDDFRKLAPYCRRRTFAGRVVRDYFGGDLRRTGVVIFAQKLSARSPLTGALDRTDAQKILAAFKPGTGMPEIFEKAVNARFITGFSGGLRFGKGEAFFLGAPAEFSLKGAPDGSIAVLELRIERKDRDSDLPILILIKSLFGEPPAPYLKETSENISGELGGMSNNYRNYECAWDLADYSARFKGCYTHNLNYSGRAGAKGYAGINESYYFEGKLTLNAKAREPSLEK